jgi:hypothetical protein
MSITPFISIKEIGGGGIVARSVAWLADCSG